MSGVSEIHELCVPCNGIRMVIPDPENIGSILLPRKLWSLGTQIEHPHYGHGVLVRIEVKEDGTQDQIFQFEDINALLDEFKYGC